MPGIDPRRPARSLSLAEVKRLAKAIRKSIDFTLETFAAVGADGGGADIGYVEERAIRIRPWCTAGRASAVLARNRRASSSASFRPAARLSIARATSHRIWFANHAGHRLPEQRGRGAVCPEAPAIRSAHRSRLSSRVSRSMRTTSRTPRSRSATTTDCRMSTTSRPSPRTCGARRCPVYGLRAPAALLRAGGGVVQEPARRRMDAVRARAPVALVAPVRRLRGLGPSGYPQLRGCSRNAMAGGGAGGVLAVQCSQFGARSQRRARLAADSGGHVLHRSVGQ